MQKTRTQTQAAHEMQHRITDGVAVTMVASVWRLPSLEAWSQFAATVSPIIGLLWLIVQILGKLSDWHGKYLLWREKRAHAARIRKEVERKKDDDTSDWPKMAGRRSGIPGDEGDTWP